MSGRALAIFDFDDTLTHGDTLGLWLDEIAGTSRFAYCALRAATGCWFFGRGADRRTRFKDLLWRDILAGISLGQAQIAAEAAYKRIHWRAETCDIFQDHLAHGRQILIATGAARLCAEIFIRIKFDNPPVTVMGTELECVDGTLTGNMSGPNCVRKDKAALVKKWLDQQEPYARIYGYGNAPHDVPMLALVTDPNIV